MAAATAVAAPMPFIIAPADSASAAHERNAVSGKDRAVVVSRHSLARTQ